MRSFQYCVFSLDLVSGLSHSKGDHREIRAVEVDQLEQDVDFGARPFIGGAVAGSTSSLLAPKGDLFNKVEEGVFGRRIGG